MTAALAITELTADEARHLTEQIRVRLDFLLPLIKQAFEGRADRALGYESWQAYCTAELGDVRVPLGDRPAMVAELRQAGMSQRAIGAALGVDQKTVSNDLRSLATEENSSVGPDRVVSLDGRERPAARPQTPEPAAVPSAAPAGSGPAPAPAADAPVPRQEPDLAERVWHVLDQHGNPPFGLTIPEMWVKLPGVHSSAIPAALAELAAAGRAVVMSHAQGDAPMEQRARWLTRKTAESERIAAVAEVAPEFVKPVDPKPSLRLVATEDEKRAAVQRDARGLLRRAVEILAPAHDRPGFAETWARQLGPYDDELSALIRRASEAISTLDELIEGCGQ